MSTTDPGRARRPDPTSALLGVVVGLALVLSAVQAVRVFAPRVFFDEIVYMEAARSLAQGDGLGVRGGGYGYAPLFPILAAAVLRVVGAGVAGYHTVLAVNAVVLTSSVVPVWLLARRVMPSRAASIAAVATLSLPVTLYAGYFMTDALGFTVALWALLAIQHAAERPTAGRQVVALVACGVAVGVRFQFAVLVPTLLAAILAAWLLGRERVPFRGLAARLWPLWAVLAAGLALGLARAAAGDGSALLGSYGVLWKGYGVLETLRWSVYHVFDLTLYLFVLPALCLPYALVGLGRAARASPAHAAFLATLVSAVASGLLLVGLFSTTSFAEGRLHDRYLVYLVPLLVVALAWWWTEGLPRSRAGTAGMVAVALVALLVPFRSLVLGGAGTLFDGVATAVWAVLGDAAGGAAAHVAFVVVLAALTGLAALGSVRALRVGLVACIVLSAVVSLALREGAVAVSDRGVYATPSERTWVDAVAGSRDVTMLLVVPTACGVESLARTMAETEFFNGRIGRVVRLGAPLRISAAETAAAVRRGGLVDERGRPVVADLLLAPDGVRPVGRPLARGTTERLRLWEIGGTVRFADESTAAAVLARVCAGLSRSAAPGGAVG